MDNITKPKAPSIKPPKETKYSYSRLETFFNCGWQYKLRYEDKLYVESSGLAALTGTLVHAVEEKIAGFIMAHQPIDYDALRDWMDNVNIPEKPAEYDSAGNKKKGSEGGIYGMKILAERFKEEFYELNKDGNSYFTKLENYKANNIYRLENYMKSNPNLEIIAVEKEFNVHVMGFLFHGYIDRILYDHDTGEYIVEDIKTKEKPFPDKQAKKSLQFTVYACAVKKLYNLSAYPTRFNYDLVFIGQRQPAGSKDMMQWGLGQLSKAFDAIKDKDFVPHPSPLCAWCAYSETNPHQPKEGRGYCPYYSLWTPNGDKKVWQTNMKFNPDTIDADIEAFRDKIAGRQSTSKVAASFDFSELAEEKPKKPSDGEKPQKFSFDF